MSDIPWAIGSKAVLDWFDDNVDENAPYWSLWTRKQLMGSFNNGDETESREKLEKNLKAFESAGLRQTLTLKLHDVRDGARITDKSDYYSSFNFQPSGTTALAGLGLEEGFPNNPRLNEMAQKVIAQESRIAALEAQLAAEEEGEGDGNLSGAENPWITLLQSPQVQSELIPRVMGLIDKILPPAGGASPGQQMGSMGNMPAGDPADQEQKINQAIAILWPLDQQLGDHLLKLAAIARDKPEDFKFLLNMLNK